jgi:hypothetical protein
VNLRTIAEGIATVVGTVTVGTESVTATASLPNQVGKLALLVYPPSGNLALLMGGPHMNAHVIYHLRLLRDPVSMSERSAAILDWATALYARLYTNFDLDIAGVLEANPTDIRVEIDGEKYSSVDGTFAVFDVVDVTVNVHVYELQAVT